MTHRFASTLPLPKDVPTIIHSLAGKVYRDVSYVLDSDGQGTSVNNDGPFCDVDSMYIKLNVDKKYPPKPVEISAYWNAVVGTADGNSATILRSTIGDDRTALNFMETDGDGHMRGVGLYKFASACKTSQSAKPPPEAADTQDESTLKRPVVTSENGQSNVETADLAVASQWFKFGPRGHVVPLDDSITGGFPTVIAEPQATSSLPLGSLFGKEDTDTHLTVPGGSDETSAGGKGKRGRRLSAVFEGFRKSMSRRSSRGGRSGGSNGSGGGDRN